MPRRGKRHPTAAKKAAAAATPTSAAPGGGDWFSSAFGQRQAASGVGGAGGASSGATSSTTTAESVGDFAATVLADVAASLADGPGEALRAQLERFRDALLLRFHRPTGSDGEAAAAAAAAAAADPTVLASLGNTIDMSTGVAGIKPVRKKMALLLKHLHRLAARQQEEAAREAQKTKGPAVFDLEAAAARERPALPAPSAAVAGGAAAGEGADDEFCSASDDEEAFDLVDPHVGDLGSMWADCKAEGQAWGGRGRGGRGIARQHQCMSLYTRDIILRAVSLAFGGKELLEDAELRIVHGHRYGLIGDNGVGKSTLLRQLANHGIPGQPMHLRCLYVKQEISVKAGDTRTTAEVLVQDSGLDRVRASVAAQITELSKAIDDFEFSDHTAGGPAGAGLGSDNDSDGGEGGGGGDEEALAEMHERLVEFEDELDGLDDAKLMVRAESVLAGLGFAPALINGPVAALSGGWRMRLAIAQAFFQRPAVLLLDEPTNHLDIDGVLWLQSYLTDPARMRAQSVVVVSHDRAFLQAVATDIIIFKDRKLTEFAGTIAEYYATKDESQRFKLRLLDQRIRQEAKAQESIQKAQQRQAQQARKGGKKHVNEKAQKQLKQQKNKMGRIGLYRDDGKRYKQNSLKRLDEGAVRLASKISGADIEAQKKELKFTFGAPTALRSGADAGDLISTERVSCGYRNPDTGTVTPVLHDVTFRVAAGARVALVGPNGAGKSTLVKLLHRQGGAVDFDAAAARPAATAATAAGVAAAAGATVAAATEEMGAGVEPASGGGASASDSGRRRKRSARGELVLTGGALQRATGVRTALVQQHHVAALGKHASKTAVEYLAARFHIAPQDARQHLGKFGLVGNTGITKIRALSGGQQMRLYLASVFFDPPHLLILDEPTNHLDMDALDALGRALEAFEGAVVVISHNQHFCSQFCTSLYEVDGGEVACVHAGDDREHFDSVFTKYKARKFEHMARAGGAGANVDMRAARDVRGYDDGARRGHRKVAGAGKQTALF